MKILHLYFDYFNLYGQWADIEILKKHLQDQGLETVVDKLTIGDDINILDYDFIYCGSGYENILEFMLNDLIKYKEDLIKYISMNKVILFSGNSMEMLGKKLNLKNGLSILDFTYNLDENRLIGDVLFHDITLDETNLNVGFINCAGQHIGNPNLFKIKEFYGEKGSIKFDGYRLNNLFATHIYGPLFIKNPKFINTIVNLIMKNLDLTYKEVFYDYEDKIHNVSVKQLLQRGKI